MEKTKVFFVSEEWYPVFTEVGDRSYANECEIPNDLLERYRKAYKEFVAVKYELSDEINK